MKIKSGEHDVLYSGTVIGVNDEPLIFEFPETASSMKFIFNFIKDTSITGSETRPKKIDSKTLEIEFVNFSSSLGTGNVEIWEIGFLNNRKLYLNFRVFAITTLSNTLHYTFYLGKEISNAGK